MIKKSMKMMAVIFASSILFTSCYSYTSVVGNGAQGDSQTTERNDYLIFGLAEVGVSDSKKMAEGAENYTVNTRQTFVNGLLFAITFGIYTPTTTTVTK
tara:strand:+ start:5706 stop:6002 length:297 start_codon:yes stop_codon:yes gene_type:complete